MPVVINGATDSYRREYLRHKKKHHITVVGSVIVQPIIASMAGNPPQITISDGDYLYEKLGITEFNVTATGGNAEYSILSD